MTVPSTPPESAVHGSLTLVSEGVQFVGRLAALSLRDATALVEQQGGHVVDEEPTLIVLGEEATSEQLGEAEEIQRRTGAELFQESEFVERLGLIDEEQGLGRLYTTAMLAGLVGVPVAVLRRWERRGHLQATERLNRLAYYDFHEATVAKRLAALHDSGKSLEAIDRLLDSLARSYPEVERPLADLPVVVEEGVLLLRDGELRTEPGGQRLIDFDSNGSSDTDSEPIFVEPEILSLAEENGEVIDPRQLARDLQDAGRLNEAIESWRVAMLQEAVVAEDHFTLAELLYESGDASAARERYYMALELDPDYLEARVNLGCVHAEQGDDTLAVASFFGAIEAYEPFADAHYHLASLLDGMGDPATAEQHWRRFLEIAPESPWADEARERLS